MTFTGNAGKIDFKLLLPGNRVAASVTVNGMEVSPIVTKMENSAYVDFTTPGPGVYTVSVRLK